MFKCAKKKFPSSSVIFFLVFFDQLIKLIVVSIEYPYVLNTGIAFGLFAGIPLINLVVSIFFLLVVFLFKKEFGIFVFCFICAGAVSNIIDRIIYSGVIDYIILPILPAFNLADLFINIGVISYIYKNIKLKSNKYAENE
jgi:signal peptidase II